MIYVLLCRQSLQEIYLRMFVQLVAVLTCINIVYFIFAIYFLSQIKNLIKENNRELDELVNELNLSTCREEFGNWAAEITACGNVCNYIHI